MSLFERALDDANLFAAWDKVRRNKGAAGSDGQTIEQFSVNAFGRLLTLKQQVERGEYTPATLLEVHIPKPSGGKRRLLIPTVRDRILQTAWVQVLTEQIEKELEEPSFAYRVGRSVPMAVARVAWYRDQGYRWVVDADIESFFDRVDHGLLLAKLRQTLDDHSLLPMIECWLSATVQPVSGQPWLLDRGIPQGSPISPLLANLYLDDLDEALLAEGLRFVRFADDFVILCKDRSRAEAALELTEQVLDALKLAIKPEKTRITDFENGFRFLGVDFIRNLMAPAEEQAAPWVLPKDPPEPPPGESPPPPPSPLEFPEVPPEVAQEILESLREPLPEQPSEDDAEAVRIADEHLSLEENPALDPLLRTLYVTRPGLKLLKEGERLLVAHGREVLASVPLHRIDQVVLQGNQLISTALATLAGTRLHFVLLDAAGRFRGTLSGASHPDLALARRQFARDGSEAFSRMVASGCVEGKIHNTRVILRRFLRRHGNEEAARLGKTLARLQERLGEARELNAIRGVEGAAAHAWFRAVASLLPDSWRFPGRRRRPPRDPFNALISYGYGVLFHTVHTLLARRGLDPWLGHLHVADGRHPALVSDLMEEFRPLIVDSVALNALLNQFTPEDFEHSGDPEAPCRLRDAARRKYLQWLQNRFRTQVLDPHTGKRIDYHRLIQAQVWHYADVVLGREKIYRPYKAR